MNIGLTFKPPKDPGYYLMKMPEEGIRFVRLTDTLWSFRIEHDGEFFGHLKPNENNKGGAFIHPTRTMWSERISTYINETPLELLK